MISLIVLDDDEGWQTRTLHQTARDSVLSMLALALCVALYRPNCGV